MLKPQPDVKQPEDVCSKVPPEVYAQIYTRGFAEGVMYAIEFKEKLGEFAKLPVEGRVN